jgi:hypothetical protein
MTISKSCEEAQIAVCNRYNDGQANRERALQQAFKDGAAAMKRIAAHAFRSVGDSKLSGNAAADAIDSFHLPTRLFNVVFDPATSSQDQGEKK